MNFRTPKWLIPYPVGKGHFCFLGISGIGVMWHYFEINTKKSHKFAKFNIKLILKVSVYNIVTYFQYGNEKKSQVNKLMI